MSETEGIDTDDKSAGDWRIRLAFIIFVAIAVAVVWVTNQLLTERFTETTRNRAEVRLALYTGNLQSELQRNSTVPLLLSRDPALIGALNSSDFSQTTQRLIGYKEEIGAASLLLLNMEGRAVASTNRLELGSQHRAAPYFVEALRSDETVFATTRSDNGRHRLHLLPPDRGERADAGRDRGGRGPQALRGVVGRVLRRGDGDRFRRQDRAVHRRPLARPDRGGGAGRALRAVGHPARAAGDGGLGGPAGGRVLPGRHGDAAGGAHRVPGLADGVLHHLRERAGAGEHLHRSRDHGLRDSPGRRAVPAEPPGDQPVGVLPAGVGGTSPAERARCSGKSPNGSGRKRTSRWPNRRSSSRRNWRCWARCRRA